MTVVPNEKTIEGFITEAIDIAAGIEGWLNNQDIQLLVTAGAYPTCAGEVLEIGTYRGKSTVLLAKAARFAERPGIVAVDPMTYGVDGKLTEEECREHVALLHKNLSDHGVADEIEFFEEMSYELAPRWDRPLRLLWIDGEHSFEGAKRDFELFLPHLSKGAIVAFHDVSRHWEGPVRVFIEMILQSNNFGCCGVSGNIGYGQYIGDDDISPYREAKLKLENRLLPILKIARDDRPLRGIRRIIYKRLHKRVHDAGITPAQWRAGMTFHPE